MSEAKACIFCRIVRGEAPATVVYRDELVTAFHDLRPATPTHILIIPNEHVESMGALAVSEGETPDLSADQAAALARVFAVAIRLARREGLSEDGFRLVANTGRDGGQSVDHLHWHLLGGRRLGWPPG